MKKQFAIVLMLFCSVAILGYSNSHLGKFAQGKESEFHKKPSVDIASIDFQYSATVVDGVSNTPMPEAPNDVITNYENDDALPSYSVGVTDRKNKPPVRRGECTN